MKPPPPVTKKKQEDTRLKRTLLVLFVPERNHVPEAMAVYHMVQHSPVKS